MEKKKGLLKRLTPDQAGILAIVGHVVNISYAASLGYSHAKNPQPLPVMHSIMGAGGNAFLTGVAGKVQPEKNSSNKTRNWAIGGAVASEVTFWGAYSLAYWISYVGEKIF